MKHYIILILFSLLFFVELKGQMVVKEMTAVEEQISKKIKSIAMQIQNAANMPRRAKRIYDMINMAYNMNKTILNDLLYIQEKLVDINKDVWFKESVSSKLLTTANYLDFNFYLLNTTTDETILLINDLINTTNLSGEEDKINKLFIASQEKYNEERLKEISTIQKEMGQIKADVNQKVREEMEIRQKKQEAEQQTAKIKNSLEGENRINSFSPVRAKKGKKYSKFKLNVK